MNWFRKQAESSEIEQPDEWSQRRSYTPMEVVRTDDGSLVPPHDDSWDDAMSLQWSAGVLKADTGFVVTFYQPSSGRNEKVDWTRFGMIAPEGASALASIMARDFWLFAVGVRWGVEWAKAKVEV